MILSNCIEYSYSRDIDQDMARVAVEFLLQLNA